MLILIVSPFFDPAGVGWNLHQAINKYTPHRARHIMGMTPELIGGPMFPEKDIIIQNYDKNKLKELVNEADVLHFNLADWMENCYCAEFCFADLMTRTDQKIIWHGHGGAWLLDPEKQVQKCKERNAVMVTCSPIDEIVVPGIKWIPNILNLSHPELLPDWTRNFKDELICSMASNYPVFKGGEIAEYVFEYLQKFGYQVKFEIKKQIIRSEVFQQRRPHHFTIDNWVQGFFGMAGLEGLALAQIVIARLDPLAEKRWQEKIGSLPPIANVRGMDECAKVIREYYADRDKLFSDCQRNRKWIEENYSEEKIIGFWRELYES